MLDDHRGLLLVNQPRYIAQEVFRIHPVQPESRRLDLLQDCPDRCPSELGLFSQLADQIVLHGGVNRCFQLRGLRLVEAKCLACLERLVAGFRNLFTALHDVLKRSHSERGIQFSHALRDQFCGFKLNRVHGLLVDPTPESLELLLLEIGIERILLPFPAILDLRQLRSTEYGIDQLEDMR